MSDSQIWRLRIAWGTGETNIDDYHQSKFYDPSKRHLEQIANEITEAASKGEKCFYELKTIDQIIKYRLSAIMHIVIYPEKSRT
jgi:hypothetical protein